MAYTLLADVIVPEVILNYTKQNSAEKTALINSGIAGPVDGVVVPDGGDSVVVPFFNDLQGDLQMMQTDTEITVNKVTTGADVARVLYPAAAWGSEDLAADLAGADPMELIADRIMAYWDRQLQKVLIAQLQGVFADNLSTNDGDLVLDIASEDFDAETTPANFLLDGNSVLDGKQLLGDAQTLFTGMAVHSRVYTNLQKNNLIEFIPESKNDVGFGTYLGKYAVIVDDSLPVEDGVTSGTKYTTFLFAKNAVAYNEGNVKVPLEVARDAGKSRDALYSRKRFIMHPRGIKWVEGSVAGDTPEVGELKLAANHSRVFDKKHIRIAMIISNG